MTTARGFAFDRATIAFLVTLLALTALRVYALTISPIDLYFDEAQYWMWSRSFEWGYFTKPPMVAWMIAATTSFFGDAEWAVRLGAPLAHAVTGLAMFALARSLYGPWAGFWAGIGWIFIPGVWLSSSIVSTDAFLLPFWAIALFAFWRLAATRAWSWAIMAGAAIGLGLLAKYAMLYFVVGIILSAWWVKPVREALGGGRGIILGAVALAVFLPNILWNVQHGFVTASHTASNLDLQSNNFFQIHEVFEFLSGQMLLIGPLLFAPLIWLLWRAVRHRAALSTEDKFLLAFVLPALVTVTIIAIVTRANANWAVASYVAGIVWISGQLVRGITGKRILAAALFVNAAIGGATLAVSLHPEWSNQFKGIRNSRAWEETAREIALRAAVQPGEAPFTAVLVDHRALYFELAYYWRHARRAGAPLPPVRMWLLHGEARNSAESIDPMRPEEGGRVLVVHMTGDYLPFVAADFSVFRTVEHLTIPLGGAYARELEISVGEGFAPAPRDAAFRERLRILQQGD